MKLLPWTGYYNSVDFWARLFPSRVNSSMSRMDQDASALSSCWSIAAERERRTVTGNGERVATFNRPFVMHMHVCRVEITRMYLFIDGALGRMVYKPCVSVFLSTLRPGLPARASARPVGNDLFNGRAPADEPAHARTQPQQFDRNAAAISCGQRWCPSSSPSSAGRFRWPR